MLPFGDFAVSWQCAALSCRPEPTIGSRPYGTRSFSAATYPVLEVLGYFQPSLRDEDGRPPRFGLAFGHAG